MVDQESSLPATQDQALELKTACGLALEARIRHPDMKPLWFKPGANPDFSCLG
jgi:hypothetical protein